MLAVYVAVNTLTSLGTSVPMLITTLKLSDHSFLTYPVFSIVIQVAMLGLAVFLWCMPEIFAGKQADRSVPISVDALRLLPVLLTAIGTFFSVEGAAQVMSRLFLMSQDRQLQLMFGNGMPPFVSSVTYILAGLGLLLYGRDLLDDAGRLPEGADWEAGDSVVEDDSV
ncbi:hypothetical protein BH11ARM1_BH11ARM1_05970 [soil metagenome]